MFIAWLQSNPGYALFTVFCTVALIARQAWRTRSGGAAPVWLWAVALAALGLGAFLSAGAAGAVAHFSIYPFVLGVIVFAVWAAELQSHLRAQHAQAAALRSRADALDSTARALESEKDALQTQEAALRDSVAEVTGKLQLHIEQTPLGAMEIDTNGIIREWNSAAGRIFGFSHEEAVGRAFLEIIVPSSSLPRFTQLWNDLLGGQAAGPVKIENATKDGRVILCEWRNAPMRNTHGEISGIAALCEDITERQRAAREIENLAAFPRYNPNPVMQFSEQGELVYFNESAQEMTRTLGCRLVSEILPADCAGAVRECLAANDNQIKRETRVGSRTIAWSFFPIPAIRCVHCYASDITERLNLEQQLRQSQKMQSVGQLAAGVAHDFNNVLTIIQGHSELISGSEKLTRSGIDSLEQVRLAADRAAKLTQQLLTFGRKQFMQMELLDVNEVIQRVTQMLRRVLGENVSLRSNLAARLPMIEADVTMMEQVIMNLSVNARDAMPGGGSLIIGTVPVLVSQAYVERNPEAREGTFICLSVSDNGTGIEADKIPKLFEPFFTTKEVGKGTGLGLATVYGIVKQHQGWIELESELGKGSIFKVFLPASAKSTSARNGKEAPQKVRGGKETVLLVEDESGVLSLARGVLKSYGYDVLEARSGVEALRVWAQHDTRIDLLLTDIVMPEGMSGLDLARKLRGEKHDLRVLYSSGYSIEVAGQDFGLTDGMAFLKKPWHPQALALKVRECLDLPA